MNSFEWEPIDAAELEAEVRRQAAERPDFVYQAENRYEGCQYTHSDGTPGCIVGAALAATGRPVPYESRQNTATDVEDLAEIHSAITGDYRWVWQVQKYQDANEPWGTAVEHADKWKETNDLV